MPTSAVFDVLKHDFEAADTDANGWLDKEELRELLKLQLTRKPSKTDIEQFMREFDRNKDSRISFSEYMEVTLGRDLAKKLNAAERKMFEADFKALDKDHSGYLCVQEVRSLAAAQLSRKPSDAELDAFMEQFDVDGDGVVTFPEYLNKTLGYDWTIVDPQSQGGANGVEIQIQLKPGANLGITLKGARVLRVEKGSQAEEKGITQGWLVREVKRTPVPAEEESGAIAALLEKAAKGYSKYTVGFSIPEEDFFGWCHKLGPLEDAMKRQKSCKWKEKCLPGAGGDLTLPHEVADIYDVKEVIGRGYFAEVFRVVMKSGTEEGDEHALKAINTSEKHGGLSKQSALREAQIMYRARHYNVVRVFGCWSEDDWPYVWFSVEMLPGGTLEDYVHSHGPLIEEAAVQVFSQLAGALDYLHDKLQIVHRDVKPANIFLLEHVVPAPSAILYTKLGNFHFSTKYDTRKNIKQFHGSCAFAAPEMIPFKDVAASYDWIRGKPQGYNRGVDCWAAGIVLFFVLSMRNPFRGSTMEELDYCIYHAQYCYDDLPADLSGNATDLIGRLLTKDPRNRHNMKEALAHSWTKGLLDELPEDTVEMHRMIQIGSDESSSNEIMTSVHSRSFFMPKGENQDAGVDFDKPIVGEDSLDP